MEEHVVVYIVEQSAATAYNDSISNVYPMIDAPLRNDKMEKSEAVRSGRMISRPLEILLRLFGIWPGASFNPFFKVLWLFITTSSIVSQYLFLINHIRSVDLSTFLYGMAATCGFSVMYIKLVVFWLNQR